MWEVSAADSKLSCTPSQDKEDVFERELRRGLNPNAAPFGQTMLFSACGYGFLRLVDYLFVQGSNLHVFSDIKDAKYLPIEVAALMGHGDVVKYLLAKGAFPGRAVMFAAQAGQVEVVEDMANAGVMLDLCVDGHSPLSGLLCIIALRWFSCCWSAVQVCCVPSLKYLHVFTLFPWVARFCILLHD